MQEQSEQNKKQKKVKKVSHLPALTRNYDKKDFESLCENEYFRFQNHAKKVGVIYFLDKHNTQAFQYDASSINLDSEHVPVVRKMINIKKNNINGVGRYEANSPTGTVFVAKRFVNFEFNHKKEGVVAFFSPTKKSNFWGVNHDEAIFNEGKVDEKFLIAQQKKYKAGSSLSIIRHDIPEREKSNRNPSQNGVMGHSAKKELEFFYDENKETLTPSIATTMKRSVNAPLYNPFFSNYRPEWLHAYGWGLMPVSKNAQISANLGAAAKWTNTEMMLLERIAKWFALNKTDAKVSIKPSFTMLLDTDIIKHIDFSIKVRWNGNKIKLKQSLDPFYQYPVFRKASDIALATFLIEKLMSNEKEIITTVVQPVSQPQIDLTAFHPVRPLVGKASLKRKRDEI